MKLHTTAQYIARKTLKERYYSEYLESYKSLKETNIHELPPNPTRKQRTTWMSCQSQRAIRAITARHYNEYREEYKKAVALGYSSSHNVKERK